MDEFLDGEIGDNSKLLPDLLRGLKKKESTLQDQASQNSFLFVYTCRHENVCMCTSVRVWLPASSVSMMSVIVFVQLSGIESDQGANEWQRVVSDVRKTVSELGELKSRCTVLVQETRPTTRKEEKNETELEGVAWLSERGRRCVREVEPLVRELVQLDKLHSYLTWMRKLQQLT